MVFSVGSPQSLTVSSRLTESWFDSDQFSHLYFSAHKTLSITLTMLSTSSTNAVIHQLQWLWFTV